MTMKYTVTVTDWTQPRGYRDSGRGWRVCCIGLPDDNWNALGTRVFEQFYRTEKAARDAATRVAEQWKAEVL